VLVHCVAAYSRTPAVGALYGARLRSVDVDEAVRDVTAVLPGAFPTMRSESRCGVSSSRRSATS
ncbi:MAG: hypothetical protein QOC76_4159, partial [Mycobacterium sp.]|nr:hypothetical protein [Mycobacterium sp.]